MSILEVTNLKFKYRDIDLFQKVSFHLEVKEHVVIVGENGVGKSTFMKLISKNLIPDSGKITWLPHIKYSYLDQHLEMNNEIKIIDYLTGTFKSLFLKEQDLIKCYELLGTASEEEFNKLSKRIELINKELEENNFYAISSTISNVTNGLGINNIDNNRLISSLSGGEKMKVYLAKLMLEEPDVLLLDEPTNGLDKRSVVQFIEIVQELKTQGTTFLMASHNEYEIKELCDTITEIEAGQIVENI